MLSHPRSTVDPQARTLILWINDAGIFNKGWMKLDGIDFNASYDWDWGNLGAFSAGIVGTYYLHRYEELIPGSPGSMINDQFHTTLNAGAVNEARGVGSLPRFRYRARLGWSKGPWSITGFMDFNSHFFHTQSAPPDVNGNFCASNGGLDAAGAGGTYLCAIQDYTNLVPSFYTFDLSIGFDTMDIPANEYLRNIGIQVVIQNIMDQHPAYAHRIGTGGGQPCTCDILRSNVGRQISLILTNQW